MAVRFLTDEDQMYLVQTKPQTLTDAQKAQARANIDAVSSETLHADVSEALTEAKQSGMFDGPAGPTGPRGPAGNTPAKGTDYWTTEDQRAIVADVLAALPTWEGGSY